MPEISTRRARAVLRRYCAEQGLTAFRLRELQNDWNRTFRVDAAEGRFLLRLARPEGADLAAARAEAAWLRSLTDSGIVVPEPFGDPATLDLGAPRTACLHRWVAGRPLERPDGHALRDLGRLLARLQAAAEGWTAPAGFARVAADALDAEGRRGGFRFDPTATAARAEAVVPGAGDAVRRAHDGYAGWRAGLPASGFGVIHADLHPRNAVAAGGSLGAIDFDDCGLAPWLFDLASPVVAIRREGGDPAPLIAAYAGARGADLAALPLVLRWKELQRVHWAGAYLGDPVWDGWARAEVRDGLRHLVSS